MLTSPKAQESLIRLSLALQSLAEDFQVGCIDSALQRLNGRCHCISNILQVLQRFFILKLFFKIARHVHGALLALKQRFGILHETLAERCRFLSSQYIPSCSHDLLLHFGQLFRLLATLALLLLLLLLFLLLWRHRLPFAEDLFERSNFRKEHFAINSSRISVAVKILCPKEIAKQLIGLSL